MAKISFKSAVAKAKTLYKSGKYKRFSDAVAAAYRGAKSSVSERTPAKRKVKRVKRKAVKRTVTAGKIKYTKKKSADSPLSNAQKQLGQAYSSYVRAGTVRDTKKASKRITEIKGRIRKILK